jgi:hypothetical protein
VENLCGREDAIVLIRNGPRGDFHTPKRKQFQRILFFFARQGENAGVRDPATILEHRRVQALHNKFTLILMAGATMLPAGAQAPPRNIMRIESFHVRPENAGAFQAAAKENVAMLTKASARHGFTIWTSESGALEYMRIDLFAKWAELDRNSYADLTDIAAERARILAAIESRIEDTRRVILRILPGAGMPLESLPPSMMEIEWRTIQPGKAAEFTALTGELVRAWKKAGVEFTFAARVIYGGPAAEFAHFIGMPNWAVIDGESPFRKSVGEEEYARYGTTLTPITASRHNEVYRFRPDLSYLPNVQSAPK